MPYHLQPGTPLPTEIKRIVREEIASAADQLQGHQESDRDTAIHETRKSVKKIRGVLRLVQPELGAAYRAENLRFRDAGRRLSVFRDAGAMLEIFDALLKEYRARPGVRALDSIRRALVARKEQAEHQAHLGEKLRRMAAAWRRWERRVAAWPLQADGFEALAAGLEGTFRRSRKAMRRARKHAAPEDLHEWRKRVKDHWYHVRLLENYWSGRMKTYEKRLKELETALGEDHNLLLLEHKLRAEPASYGQDPAIDLFFRLSAKYHEELRARAFKLGERLYQEKPRQFTSRMQRLWRRIEAPPRRTALSHHQT